MPARRTRVAAALLALGVLGSGPLPTRAIDDTPAVALPSEPAAQTIPGPTRDAVTADLDGDGARELVRLTTADGGSGSVSVEAWVVGPAGEAALALQALVRRDASVEEALFASPRPAPDNTLPVLVNDTARLLVVRDGDAERVVLAAIGAGDEDARPCCLTLYEVRLPPGGNPALARLGGIQQDADALLPLDLDGDGTDELVAIEGRDDDGALPLRVYRPFGDAMATDVVTVDAITADARNASIGETDGRTGQDLLLTATHLSAGQGPETRLVRLTLGADGPVAETALLGEPAVPFVIAGSTPTLVVSYPLASSTEALTWPAGTLPRRTAQLEVTGSVLTQLGAGADARLLFAPSDDPSLLLVLDAELGVPDEIHGRTDAQLLRSWPAAPYVGPWPGTDAVVFLGQRITADGNTEPMATLPGSRPVGPLGPGDAITALLWGSPAVTAPPDPRLVAAPAAGSLELVATNALLRPEAGNGRLEIGLRGAIFDGSRSAVVTPGPSFDVLVAAPPGSRVMAAAGPGEQPDPATAVTAVAGTTVVPVRLPADATQLTALVVTPSGAGYHGTWPVELRTGPPPLVLEVPVLPLSGSVRITGSTEPGSTATVNGAEVPVDADGRFETRVSATLAPTSHRVEVVDPVGNVASERLSVVGWVDYRRLPWIPIISLLTLAAGIALWLRVPRPRSWRRRDTEDDAALEEIDA